MNEYNEQAVETLDDAGCIIANKNIIIDNLQARIAELGEEVERLKRTNSSYANLTKAQESQLTNLRQRLYQLKGADSAIDSERQANCDLTEQLAAEQLNNKRLQDGVTAVNDLINASSGVAGLHLNGDIATWEELRTGGRFEEWLCLFDEALATPISTEALDAYVKQKIKEYY